MPRGDSSPLGPSARHIAREYARARTMGVTQEEFARNAGLGSGRYLRKILTGQRSGSILEKRAASGGAFTVPLEYKGSEASINIRLPARVSRIDIYQPKVQKAIRKELATAQREERLKAAPLTQVSTSQTARVRGKARPTRMRYAKHIRRAPVVVLP